MNKEYLLSRLEFFQNMEGRIKLDIEYTKGKEPKSINFSAYNEDDLQKNTEEMNKIKKQLKDLEK